MADISKPVHFENDIGKSIEFRVWDWDVTLTPPAAVLVNIASAITQDITFIRPGAAVPLVVSGTFLTDGTDSISRYKTVDGDLTPVGDWEGQLRIEMPDGQFYTSIIEFEVEEHL